MTEIILNQYRTLLRDKLWDFLSPYPYGEVQPQFNDLPEWSVFYDLKWLSDRHILGILSDNSLDAKARYQQLFESAGFDYFSFFIVSEEVGVCKPDAGIFSIALQQAQTIVDCDPSEILYFGDNFRSIDLKFYEVV